MPTPYVGIPIFILLPFPIRGSIIIGVVSPFTINYKITYEEHNCSTVKPG